MSDAGLQAERTELAWRRTQLSLLVVACLALRGAQPALMLLALASALVLWAGQRRRYRHSLAMLDAERGRARIAMVLGIGLVQVSLCVLAIEAALAGR
jgi:uncharacterized membrane protein YidH (DUF202 family)